MPSISDPTNQKLGSQVSSFIHRITRKKIVEFGDSKLNRSLTLLDLTLLGIGSTIGVGFYVLAGNVARSVAGPAVVVSFFIAGIASLFAGLCYAEFGARVPKAGSAYIYSYVCVGELVAFVIGWNLILEYIIGASSVARGYSGYVDELANNVISDALTDAMPIDVSFLSKYPDFLSFGLAFFVSILLAFGIKESSTMNNIFTGLNLIVVVYVIIAAATRVDFHNWSIPKDELNVTCNQTDGSEEDDWGAGGFAPYGFSGIMQGAATCFFGFVGFDCIATTGEEAINPSRNIPLSISVSLLVIFIAYFGMSSTLTLAVPYCRQDPDAPLVVFFEELGWETAKWIVSIGALFGFSASLIGVLLPLPRVVYAMANDGIIFRFLSRVNKRFKTPLIATILTGSLAGLMAMLFDLSSLVDMMSIGTLMAYTIVALSVMLLRYVPDDDEMSKDLIESAKDTKRRSSVVRPNSLSGYMKLLFNTDGVKEASRLTASVVSYATLMFCLWITVLCLLLVLLQEQLYDGEAGPIVAVVIVLCITIVNVVVIGRQPESKKSLTFKVPFVPWMPAVSSLINLYLMCNLSGETWIRFAVWMAIGFPIYFFYGICHSTEGNRDLNDTFGIDNPGGPEEGNKNNLFVIPTINVQLATPLNSAPATPKSIHNKKDKPPMPISPLALANDAKQIQSSEYPVREDENFNEKEIEKALASLNQVVNSPLASESQFSGMQDDIHDVPDISHEGSEVSQEQEESLKNSDIQLREMPQTPLEDAKTGTSNQSDSKEGSMSSNDSGYAPLAKVLAMKQQIADGGQEANIQKEESAIDPKNENVKDVEVPETELEKDSMPESTDDVNSGEPLYSTVIKKDKKKPEPLELSPGNNVEKPEYPLKRFNSAPFISSSTPSSPNPGSRMSPRSSVHSTPNLRRHPTKILKRNSSFDEIPPSSLESPNIRRVDKFFIIPVQEPDTSDSDSSPQPSPTHTFIPNNTNISGKKLEGQEDISSKLFYVNSDESLENVTNSSDMSSPTSPSHSRDSRLVPSKDMFFLGEGLDTIRERGESKINIDDVHTDISGLSHEKSTASAIGKDVIEEEQNNLNSTTSSNAMTNDLENKKSSQENNTKNYVGMEQEDTKKATISSPVSTNENVNKLRSLFDS